MTFFFAIGLKLLKCLKKAVTILMGNYSYTNNLPELFLVFVSWSCIGERMPVVGLVGQGGGSSSKMLLVGPEDSLWIPQVLASQHWLEAQIWSEEVWVGVGILESQSVT